MWFVQGMRGHGRLIKRLGKGGRERDSVVSCLLAGRKTLPFWKMWKINWSSPCNDWHLLQ